MRRLALGLHWALVALAVVAAAPPVRAREPEARASSVRSESTRRRVFLPPRQSIAPPLGFERWTQELSPIERRALQRHLEGMPEWRQREFFTRWERMTHSERGELADQLRMRTQRRAEHRLPPHLRTPEMRERIAEMSPEERSRFFERARKWRRLDREERQKMRGRLEAFGALGEAEQRALVDQKFARKDEAERARILLQLREASARLPERKAQRAAPGAAPQSAPPDESAAEGGNSP